MKISTKGEYGIRSMLELSLRYGDGYVQSSLIAGARSIPENYLYQLLITLRKSGLIRSRRGPQGGHMLARAPERISLYEIIFALEGPIEVLACAEDGETDCPFGDECPVREVWTEISETTRSRLEGITLASLSTREQEKRAQAAA